jgi:hypothetical protein
MEQMLSSKTALFANLAPLTAGGTLMALGYTEWGYIFLATSGALLALFILFIRQRIDITDIECGIQENAIMKSGVHPMGVNGFVKARHSIELLDCKLMVAKGKREYPVADGVELRQKIDNVSSSFTFYIPLEGELLDWGLIYIKVAGRLLHTPPFRIKLKSHNDKGWFKDIAEKLIPKAKQLKDEGEITKKKLHELLDKASQPIK